MQSLNAYSLLTLILTTTLQYRYHLELDNHSMEILAKFPKSKQLIEAASVSRDLGSESFSHHKIVSVLVNKC